MWKAFRVIGKKSYDEANWTQARLPLSEESPMRVVYRRNISIKNDPSNANSNNLNNYVWQLYFLGVDDEVEIYFNNQFLGRFFWWNDSVYSQITSKFHK